MVALRFFGVLRQTIILWVPRDRETGSVSVSVFVEAPKGEKKGQAAGRNMASVRCNVVGEH
jgi:hypothetical protein